MFKRTTFAALALLVAAPAFADGIAPGLAMQARTLGVEPGVYTQAQLTRLQQAYQEDDSQTVAFILANPGGTSVSTSGGSAVSAGDVEFAKTLGVAPGALSANDLQRLQDAKQDGDATLARAILAGQTAPRTDTVVTEGDIQLAAQLGVDPNAYTTAELSALALKLDLDGSN